MPESDQAGISGGMPTESIAVLELAARAYPGEDFSRLVLERVRLLAGEPMP
jgi:hypothetical protein